MQGFSQCQVIGRPPVKTWVDYKMGCLDTYSGGHHGDGHLEAFQHGMITVFNLLEAEFPPADQCKAAPEMLEALRDCVESLSRLPNGEGAYRVTCLQQARTAIAKATGGTNG